MDIETLRPSAPGDETALYPEGAATNWQCVDEAEADDDATYVCGEQELDLRDLYELPASSGSGTINKITVYIRCKVGLTEEFCAVVKSDSTVTVSEALGPPTEWETLSKEWATNPADSEAWEWADIDALQIGVRINAPMFGSGKCTQVYVEVDYTPTGWSGKISGVTNPAKVMGIDVANIAKVKGVA